MYDAVTRNTYAELFKTAEAKVSGRLHSALVKLAARHPAVRDALSTPISQSPKESRR